MTLREIMWLAGLLEGEGCFGLNGGTRKTRTPRLNVSMTDKDVVEHVARLFRSRVQHRVRGAHYKDVYTTALYARNAVAWMLTLYPLLGMRRRQAIRKSVTHWRSLRVKNDQGAGRTAPRCLSEAKRGNT